MKQWTGSAPSLEEAVRLGLESMGLAREQVDVEVLEERGSGLLSMMGFRRVRIRLSERVPGAPRRPAPVPDRDRPPRHEPRRDQTPRDDRPREGRGDRGPRQEPRRDNGPDGRRARGPREDRPRGDARGLHGGQGDMGPRSGRPPRPDRPPRPEGGEPRRRGSPENDPNAKVGPWQSPAAPSPAEPTPESLLALWKTWTGWDDLEWTLQPGGENTVAATIKSSHAACLTAFGGAAMEAFQHLFNLTLGRGAKDRPRVVFEIEGVANPRKQRAIDEAMRAAAEVRRSGRVYRLDPMDPADRRLVHQTLAGETDLETVSEGEGPYRKVVVRPKAKR